MSPSTRLERISQDLWGSLREDSARSPVDEAAARTWGRLIWLVQRPVPRRDAWRDFVALFQDDTRFASPRDYHAPFDEPARDTGEPSLAFSPPRSNARSGRLSRDIAHWEYRDDTRNPQHSHEPPPQNGFESHSGRGVCRASESTPVRPVRTLASQVEQVWNSRRLAAMRNDSGRESTPSAYPPLAQR